MLSVISTWWILGMEPNTQGITRGTQGMGILEELARGTTGTAGGMMDILDMMEITISIAIFALIVLKKFQIKLYFCTFLCKLFERSHM